MDFSPQMDHLLAVATIIVFTTMDGVSNVGLGQNVRVVPLFFLVFVKNMDVAATLTIFSPFVMGTDAHPSSRMVLGVSCSDTPFHFGNIRGVI